MNATGTLAKVTTTAQKMVSPALVEKLPAASATARRTMVKLAVR